MFSKIDKMPFLVLNYFKIRLSPKFHLLKLPGNLRDPLKYPFLLTQLKAFNREVAVESGVRESLLFAFFFFIVGLDISNSICPEHILAPERMPKMRNSAKQQLQGILIH